MTTRILDNEKILKEAYDLLENQISDDDIIGKVTDFLDFNKNKSKEFYDIERFINWKIRAKIISWDIKLLKGDMLKENLTNLYQEFWWESKFIKLFNNIPWLDYYRYCTKELNSDSILKAKPWLNEHDLKLTKKLLAIFYNKEKILDLFKDTDEYERIKQILDLSQKRYEKEDNINDVNYTQEMYKKASYISRPYEMTKLETSLEYFSKIKPTELDSELSEYDFWMNTERTKSYITDDAKKALEIKKEVLKDREKFWDFADQMIKMTDEINENVFRLFSKCTPNDILEKIFEEFWWESKLVEDLNKIWFDIVDEIKNVDPIYFYRLMPWVTDDNINIHYILFVLFRNKQKLLEISWYGISNIDRLEYLNILLKKLEDLYNIWACFKRLIWLYRMDKKEIDLELWIEYSEEYSKLLELDKEEYKISTHYCFLETEEDKIIKVNLKLLHNAWLNLLQSDVQAFVNRLNNLGLIDEKIDVTEVWWINLFLKAINAFFYRVYIKDTNPNKWDFIYPFVLSWDDFIINIDELPDDDDWVDDAGSKMNKKFEIFMEDWKFNLGLIDKEMDKLNLGFGI